MRRALIAAVRQIGVTMSPRLAKFGLFAHFKAYHSQGESIIQFCGVIGVVAFPLFYLLRFTKAEAPFNDIGLRVVAVLLCAGLALHKHWPRRMAPYYLAHTYLTLLYCIPFFFVFTSLANGGGVVAVANTLMAVFFLVLLSDWRNTVFILLAGSAAATASYVAFAPNPQLPHDYVARLPILLLVIVGGSVFKHAQKQTEAEAVRRTYTALAASIAHEMRNPLGQIKQNLQRLQQALPAPTTTAQAQPFTSRQVDELYRHLAQSELAVNRGLQLITRTLDEVSARPVDTTAFSYLSAAQCTHKAVQEYAFESDEDAHKVDVQVTNDFSFRGDETAYLFVLFNLIKNALYYLAVYPTARVRIAVGKNQVTVRDTGPGIPAHVLAQLFQPFSSVGKSGGTGLGLAYCRRVMHAFGGEIRCDSKVGQYTEFTLCFPPVSEQASQTYLLAVFESARAAFSGKRILVVDDDSAQRMTTRHKLHPLDVVVDQAADGQRALEALGARRYDLVVLDLKMPVLDGYAVAERIRRGQVPLNRDVPIVAYTSEPSHLATVKIQKAGMDAFVSKPCAQLPLVQALLKALDHSRVSAAAFEGRTILLADDNPFNRRAVVAYLKDAGATVVEASHGKAAVEHLKTPGAWDAVLMDLNMPGMDGFEATRAIRASGMPCGHVPIIALTAHSDEGTLAAARKAGMNGFITKPVEAAALYRTLSEFFHSAPPVTHASPSGWSARAGQLLDLDRLESYRRIGMLEELLSDYVPEIERLVERLEGSAGRQDLPQTLDALHSLLGMSGEAGGSSLHELVRSVYVPMVETGAWPAQADWVQQIRATTLQTQQALKAHTAMHASG